LNPIERLLGIMHKYLTHNKCYPNYRDFDEATLQFLRDKVPKNWPEVRDSVTDNFRIVNPNDFRILA